MPMLLLPLLPLLLLLLLLLLPLLLPLLRLLLPPLLTCAAARSSGPDTPTRPRTQTAVVFDWYSLQSLTGPGTQRAKPACQ